MKKRNNKEIYTCLGHCEMAIDEFVNKYEIAPDMEKITSKKCDFCEKEAVYKIFNINLD